MPSIVELGVGYLHSLSGLLEDEEGFPSPIGRVWYETLKSFNRNNLQSPSLYTLTDKSPNLVGFK